jgi:hypothetical protein
LSSGYHGAGSAVELRDPHLRTAVLVGQKREEFAIGRPARAVSILIGNDLALLTSCRRHDPDVRRLGVGLEIHIDHAEDHPLAVRRNFRLSHALQLHHVFESEGVFGLGECGEREEKNEKESKTTHGDLRGTRECSK